MEDWTWQDWTITDEVYVMIVWTKAETKTLVLFPSFSTADSDLRHTITVVCSLVGDVH